MSPYLCTDCHGGVNASVFPFLYTLCLRCYQKFKAGFTPCDGEGNPVTEVLTC